MRTNKERTSSQISREARSSALTEIWKRRVKWGHTISPIHFTQPSIQLLQRNWSFSFEARYTVTRITLFRFADTTSASVPQSKDFPGARESASPPRSTKINIPAASAPRTAELYHFPSPHVNGRTRWNIPTSENGYRTRARPRADFGASWSFLTVPHLYPVRHSNSICKSPVLSRPQSRPRHLPWQTKSHLRPSAMA